MHEVQHIDEYIFWIMYHLVTILDQLIDTVMENTFKKYFAWFGGLGTKFRDFSIYQPTTMYQ